MSKEETTWVLVGNNAVKVRFVAPNNFEVRLANSGMRTCLEGLSEADIRALSKKFAEAVDCHRDAPAVSEPSPRAARDRVPQVPGMLAIRVRYYDAVDRIVTLPLSDVPGWRILPDGRNRAALLTRGGFEEWLRADSGDGGPTEAGLHQEAQQLLDQIARSSEGAGMFGYGEKYIAWRAE